MKKIYLFLVVALMVSMSLPAQVYYLLPNSNEWKSEEVINPYRNTKISQDQLQWEESGVPQNPERVAYDWFRDVYCAGIPMSHTGGTETDDANTKRVITFKDLTDGRLEANGDLFSSVKVLWVNVDRSMSVDDFDALFPTEVRTALANYVKAGGNLYLSTYASRLVSLIGRGPVPGFNENNGFSTCGTNDPWLLLVNFGTGYDNHEHMIFEPLNDKSKYGHHGGKDYDTYVMQSSSTRRTDRNCLWDIDDNTSAVSSFQTTNTCHVFGSWGHAANFTSAGLVEFYPVGNWKGTVICNGLAACSFAEANEAKDNVKLLTQGILDYLSARPDVTWGDAPTAGTIALGTSVTITPELNDASAGKATITHYVTSSSDIVDYHDIGSGDPGAVYYNYFGTATLSAKVQGDGVHFPKSEITAATTHSITVNGGTAAEPRFAYVLPYSIRKISDHDYDSDEHNNIPDFLSALWFYEHYIKEGRSVEDNYGEGCFINPKNYSSSAAIPAEIQVLWVHNDHVGQESDTYRNDLGYNTSTSTFPFLDALRAFINRGGNVFLSKQATRLLGDLGRLGESTYPTYANGGYYDKKDNWGIKNKFFTGDDIVDYSSHPVYTTPNNLEENPVLIDDPAHKWRTDNNDILFDDTYNNKSALRAYEGSKKCRLLGSWNNGGTDYQAGVFAEFLPQSAGKGTIIMLGAAAYQWTCGTQTAALDQVYVNVPKITQNILQYLSTATVVVTKPDTEIPSTVNNLVVYQGGSVSNTGDITIRDSITYIYDAAGDAGAKLGHWYTFCLPFEASKCYVVEDGVNYDINAVYMSGAEGETKSNPLGTGYFYLQSYKGSEWEYIGNNGIPVKDTPYIIKFIDADEDIEKGSALATYFRDHPSIKFVGGAQKIIGTNDATGGSASGDYSYHVNKTLHKITLSNVYTLNAEGTYFEYDYGGTSVIMPFECYIKASTPERAMAYPKLALRPRGSKEQTEIATSMDNIADSTAQTQKILYNGQVVIVRDNKMYNVLGQEL